MTRQPPAVKKVEREDGVVEYHVFAASGWDDCESLARFVVKQFGAVVVRQTDGIWSREWTMAVGPIAFRLKHHDELGNFFYARPSTAEANALLERIAEALSARLSPGA